MNKKQHKRNDDGTAVHSLENILLDGCRLATVSSAVPVFRNLPNALAKLEAALRKVAALIPRAEKKDTLNGPGDRLLS